MIEKFSLVQKQHKEQGAISRSKINWYVKLLTLVAAVFGGIDLFINPTPFDFVVEIILLVNVVIHWKDILREDNVK